MSSFLLKIFAIITMTIDHMGAILFNNNSILRIIGRIAMWIVGSYSGYNYMLRSICGTIPSIIF